MHWTMCAHATITENMHVTHIYLRSRCRRVHDRTRENMSMPQRVPITLAQQVANRGSFAVLCIRVGQRGGRQPCTALRRTEARGNPGCAGQSVCLHCYGWLCGTSPCHRRLLGSAIRLHTHDAFSRRSAAWRKCCCLTFISQTRQVHTYVFARDCVQVNCPQCELIQLNKPPMKPLRGVSWHQIDYKSMAYSFMILEVTCWVKYKYVNGDNPKSVLKLHRVDADSEKAGTLELGELVGACGNFETRQFKHEITSNKLICGPGNKGRMF